MNLQTTYRPSQFTSIALGLSVLLLGAYCSAESLDSPAITGGTGNERHSGSSNGRTPQPGLDNTPAGGQLPGGTVPGGTVQGGTLPGGTVPGGPASGGTLPGGSVPGGVLPGGTVPGGTVPGGTVPSKKLPGEDG